MKDGVQKTHPWLLAALLANGGDRRQIAIELGEPLRDVLKWSNGEEEVPERCLPELRRVAVGLILIHEKRLRAVTDADPQALRRRKFRQELDDLDLAHLLVFGQSLLHYLVKKTGGVA